MKIRRFVAVDMKSALAQIKEELGADAVIMSNKKIAEGVEIMAAVDYFPETKQPEAPADNTGADNAVGNSRDIDNDVVSIGSRTPLTESEALTSREQPADSLSALLNRKVQHTPSQPQFVETKSNVAASSTDIEAQFKSFTDRLEQSTQQRNSEQAAENSVDESNITPTEFNERAQNDTASIKNNDVNSRATSTTASVSDNVEFEHMKKEMHTIRHLLEHQLSGLMWQDMAQKNPQKALLINRLVALGLTDHMADQIAGFIPPQQNDQDAWEQAKSFITQQLNTTNNEIIHHGGVISLVGPTGVGKTTTIAKLAARFAQIHGASEVVLISTDSFRIGGFEQLTTYGRIIGCEVKLATDADALDALLQQYGHKKLVLIDTAGMGQRDMRLAQHLTELIANARVRIRNYLVLSANTQQRVMQENVERFKKIPLAGCIYTKLDESISIGEIISTSIQNGLPIGYLTDGQRVPEDIKVANAEKLVTLADRMASKTKVQEHSSAWRPMPKKTAVTA